MAKLGRPAVIRLVMWLLALWAFFDTEALFAMLPDSRHLIGASADSLVFFALLSVCVYWGGYVAKYGLRLAMNLLRGGKVAGVKAIRHKLQQSIDNIEEIAERADRLIAGKEDVVMKPAYDFDGELDKYARIAESYWAPNDRIIDTALLLLRLPTALIVGAAVLYYAAPVVGEMLLERFAERNALILMIVYLLLSFVVFYVSQRSYIKKYTASMGRNVRSRVSKTVRFAVALGMTALLFYYQGSESGWFAESSSSPVHQLVEMYTESAGFDLRPAVPEPAVMWESPYSEAALALPVLRRGAKGRDVGMLQESLNRLAEVYPEMEKLSADEDFGGMTENAVKAFQRAMGLEEDGVVDAGTWESILSALAELAPGDE